MPENKNIEWKESWRLIEHSSGGISVTLYKNNSAKAVEFNREDINERQMKAIEFAKVNGKVTNKDCQRLNNISSEMATIDLRKLVQMEIFISSGSKGAGAFYVLK